MNLRDILVFLDAGSASAGRLRLATSIARDHGASLTAAFLQDDRTVDFPPGLSVPRAVFAMGSSMTGAPDVSRAAGLTENTEQQFRDCIRSLRGEGDWHVLDWADAAGLITLARAADLIIIGQVNPSARPMPAWRPEAIVVACGRPVLMVPYIGSYDQIGRRVLVAWDGSREAARAVNDALPVISAAKAVTVMTVRKSARDRDRSDVSMNLIVRHLARHGIAVQAEEIARGSNAISDVLLSRAVDHAADLIIAGAYQRSPLREALVGGVSHELFQHMTLPVLMSH